MGEMEPMVRPEIPGIRGLLGLLVLRGLRVIPDLLVLMVNPGRLDPLAQRDRPDQQDPPSRP